MPRLRCVLLVWLCGGALFAADWPLPAIDGDLGGQFTSGWLRGAPPVPWRVSIRSARNERTASFSLDGQGIWLRAQTQLDASGRGTWTVTDAELDLATWFPAVRHHLGPDFAKLVLTGLLRLKASGVLGENGWGGKGVVSLREARLDDPERAFSLNGIQVALAVDDLQSRRTGPAQKLSWKGGQFDKIALGAGHIVFAMDGDRIRVHEVVMGAFAGQVTLDPFEFRFGDEKIAFTAHMRDAELAMFLPLLPSVVRDARGKVNGTLNLTHTPSGVKIGAGRLYLEKGDTAEFRFMPAPGLLSANLPAQAKLLYNGIDDLEGGKVPLKASAFELRFTPDGDANGRTATIHLAGEPVDPNLRAPVILDVNIRGPLDSLLRLSQLGF